MWIENLIQKLTSFIPRPILIRPDEAGFRMTPKPWGGCWVSELMPNNWYWALPLVMEMEICKTKTQVKDIRIQSVWTSDGKDIAISVSIRYYVHSPMKALLDVLDYDSSLQNIALGVVHDYVKVHTEKELRENRETLKEELLKAIREEASGWGLKIQSVKLTDCGRTSNYRILTNNGINFGTIE